jgi:hypothetical protein
LHWLNKIEPEISFTGYLSKTKLFCINCGLQQNPEQFRKVVVAVYSRQIEFQNIHRHWKDHLKNDRRSNQDHRLKLDRRSDQEHPF